LTRLFVYKQLIYSLEHLQWPKSSGLQAHRWGCAPRSLQDQWQCPRGPG
jgi:hypothetical protein